MAEIKTIYKGESVTLLFTFPEAYDMTRLISHKVFVGETEFTGVIEGQAIKMQLKSSDTDRMIGTHRIVCLIDDTTLGLRKPYCGELVIAKTQASGSNASVSNISDIIIPVVISETAVTVGDILYNYVKGDPFLYSDFTPEQIAELQQPATEAIASIEAVELAVETAEGLRVQSELNRQTNTATAIQNAETATTGANNAAGLANALKETLSKQFPPIAKVKVVIPEGGSTVSSYCDDMSSFPQYKPEDWNDDYGAFLQSLGTFKVDWGDGTYNYFSYLNDGYIGNGFTHEYTTEGAFIITWHSPFVFLRSEHIIEVVKLQALQNLDLSNCTGLTTPPDLTGLTALQTLYLGGCTSLTTSPDLTGLTALQNLDLSNCTGLTTPPDLTGLVSLQNLGLSSCTSLTTSPDLTGLTALQNLGLSNCTGLTTSPDLTGLTALQNLGLSNCTGLTTPPDLTGLTSLQNLYLSNCTGLTTPPDLTGLTSLQNLYLSNCTGLTTLKLDTILTYLHVLYANLAYVYLQNGKSPTASVLNMAKAANPQCQIYTS